MNEYGIPDEYIVNGKIEQNDKKLKNMSSNEKFEGEKIFTKIKKIFLRYRFELMVFLIFLIYLIIFRITIPIYEIGEGITDWHFYAKMARDITTIFKSEIIIPFCYRPLMPFLAGILPFDLEFNFALITFVSIYLTGIMLYFTLRTKFDKKLSAFGILIFCYLNHLGIYRDCSAIINCYFFYVYLVDSLAYFFLIVCFYAILTNKKKLFLISLILGTLVKEVILFTIPVFLIYNIFEEGDSIKIKDLFKKKSIERIFNNLIFIIPALIVFILLRVFIIPEPITNYDEWYYGFYHGYEYLSVEMIIYFLKLRIEELSQGYGPLYYTIGIWGVIPLTLCLINKRKEIVKWLKLYGIFMMLVYIQIFLAAGYKRMIYIGFFPIIFLTVSGFTNPKAKYALVLVILIEILLQFQTFF